MNSVMKYVTFDCNDPRIMSEFWSAVLGYETTPWDDYDGAMSKPLGGGSPGIAFIKVPEGKSVKNRLHLDIEPSGATMESEVERIIELGARRIEEFHEPSGTWTVMTDPEGNEFCVAQPE